MGWKEIALYGLRDGLNNDSLSRSKQHGGVIKRTELQHSDNSGDHATTFRYRDGCTTIYRHQGGRVIGYHADPKGTEVGRIDRAEGGRETKHPHHPEGPRAAMKQGQAVDWLGFLATSWKRAKRIS